VDLRETPEPSAALLAALPTLMAPLSETDALNFNRFCWKAVQLSTHSLLVGGRDRISSFTQTGVAFPPLSAEDSAEVFESLCLRFRRLYAPDSSSFGNVRGRLERLIRDRASPEQEQALEWLADLSGRHRRMKRQWIFLGVQLTPHEVLDLVFNGELFHLDREPAVFEPVRNWRLVEAGALYSQISFFETLYRSLALGISAILAQAALLPSDFEPYLQLLRQGSTES
jgi:hypothetical protein